MEARLTRLFSAAMDINRNSFFIWGALLLFFGFQFHYFDSFVLTEKASKFYYKRFEKKAKVEKVASPFLADTPELSDRKTIRPPNWLGRCLISVGAVLVFQALIIGKKE